MRIERTVVLPCMHARMHAAQQVCTCALSTMHMCAFNDAHVRFQRCITTFLHDPVSMSRTTLSRFTVGILLKLFP